MKIQPLQAALSIFLLVLLFTCDAPGNETGNGRTRAGEAFPDARNIVFISFDELGASFLGCYGSGVNSTPTMDRLAAEGARFERCYATSPVCAPNRATWLTGRSPVIHGLIFNNLALAADMPTYPFLLQQYGYRTGAFGKLHQAPMRHSPENMEYLGFDEVVQTEDDKWGPWIDWIEAEHPDYLDEALALAWGPPTTDRHQHYADRAAQARKEILEPIRQASFWAAAWESPLPKELHDNTFITDRGLDFIDRHRQNFSNQPFFCHISYVDPHDPYNPPAPYSTMFDPDSMPDPIPMEWDPEELKMLGGTLKHLNINAINDDPVALRKLRALFHGAIRFLDDEVARIESYLEAKNLLENTIIIVTTDHGEMMGDHGLITKGSKHYDSGIRVPLIVSGPGIRPAVIPDLHCSLDLYPSICDWAGIPDSLRPPLEGISFAPACSGGSGNGWEEVAIWACEEGGGAYSLITDEGWRLTRYVDEQGAGQMFNLKEDPAEQHDLYDNPDYVHMQLDLSNRLIAALTRPSRIPQYRNMPLIGGQKLIRNYQERAARLKEGIPLYKMPASKALTQE